MELTTLDIVLLTFAAICATVSLHAIFTLPYTAPKIMAAHKGEDRRENH